MAEPRCFWERYLKCTHSFCCTIRWRRIEEITLEFVAVFPGIEKLVPPTSNTVTCKSEFACNPTLSDLGVFMRIRRGWFWGFRSPGSTFLIIQVGKAMSENVARRLYMRTRVGSSIAKMLALRASSERRSCSSFFI